MEILILPLLVFLFVLISIILFYHLSACKNEADKSLQSLQIQLQKQDDFAGEKADNSLISGVENARHAYNKIAVRYNKLVEIFPTSVMAVMAGLTKRKVF